MVDMAYVNRRCRSKGSDPNRAKGQSRYRVYLLEVPFSEKFRTETKPIPIKWQLQKPNTKPIFILPKMPIFYQILTRASSKIPIKYQENTKKFGTEIPNTDLVLVISWYTKFLVSD